ncbi:MAG: FAD-dependent oxidoreductase [Ilumatobacteraceae bacterium]
MSASAAGLETDVLVVGSGPAGGAMALALATYGVKVTVITKYGQLADTPRAHITNQRTVEVLRDLGVEGQLMAKATPWELMMNTTYCTSLAGIELGRCPSWGTDPARHADYLLQSPCTMVDAPQTIVEPILIGEAQVRGAKMRYDTEYLSHVQDADGVTTSVRDRLTGAEYTIRSKFMIGADGARSQVAEDAGLPFEGPGVLAGAFNIVFEADLSHLVEHRPSVLYWMLQPGADQGGVGLGVLRMVKPWTEWMLIWGFDLEAGAPDLSDETIRDLAVKLVGTDDFEMRVLSKAPWAINYKYATRIANGRVFCAGDAIHRHPPTNGLGSNTSIQDSYNLAWKLAHVVQGKAGLSLLDTYDAERAPVAKQIVDRANKSIPDTARITQALGLDGASDAEALEARLAVLAAPGPEGEATRAAMREAVAFKSYEFNCHGVEHNQRYASTAVVTDGTPMPEYRRDAELYAQPTTWPGAKVPHAWVTRNGVKVSTLDLGGRGGFTVYTGVGGDAWAAAAAAASSQLGVEVRVVSIGHGQPFEDPYGTWAGLREVGDTGVVLTRPDNYVCFRAQTAPASAAEATSAIVSALSGVLAR